MENNNSSDRENGQAPLIENNQENNNGNRPLSYYDNTSNSVNISSLDNNTITQCKFNKNPTQIHGLSTTVPQNITSPNIAGKHTPTRNSLRHSRMIVLNKSGQAPVQIVPLFIQYHRIVKKLLILITFLGTSLCILSLLLLLWSPNIRSRDNPYWSAIPVLFSGIIGFVFLYSFPKKHPDTKLGYWIKSIKVFIQHFYHELLIVCPVSSVCVPSLNTRLERIFKREDADFCGYLSVLISLLATAASFVISAFAIIHLLAIDMLTCSPPDKVYTTCLCKNESSKPLIHDYHYVDLTCMEVKNMLYGIIVVSCLMNLIVGISEMVYIYFHWSCRNDYIYSRVQTSQRLNRLALGKR
ncbi:hypothetical protein NQ317_000139 [Molorchus minor]|uniref:Sarcospan n=1 Tax=Molorchus minor TaxID=1323400 RepID=A0ABQ9JTU4_9CUCU|nr:hypothetical protein NQ317_000139 [Molorchus minor]